MAKSILVLNGPGLVDRGKPDSSDSSAVSLVDTESACHALCDQLDIKLDFRQADSVEAMAAFIANDTEAFDGLIINPLAYSHASSENAEILCHALMLVAPLKKPMIEVHIKNIFASGDMLKPLNVPQSNIGFISGLGINSYQLAIKAIHQRINQQAA